MVVAAGLTLIEPLADVDVNVPGVMAIDVAPVAVQVNVLLAPELIPAGLAANAEMVGVGPRSVDEFDEPQPDSPTRAMRMRTDLQALAAETIGPQEMRSSMHVEFVELFASRTASSLTAP